MSSQNCYSKVQKKLLLSCLFQTVYALKSLNIVYKGKPIKQFNSITSIQLFDTQAFSIFH